MLGVFFIYGFDFSRGGLVGFGLVLGEVGLGFRGRGGIWTESVVRGAWLYGYEFLFRYVSFL